MGDSTAGASIAILVATMQRPQLLQQLLLGLSALRQDSRASTVTVLVVDNDPAASARAVVERAREHAPVALRYLCEPRRGIPHARNAALSAVVADHDFVAFIDDDEVPDPGWLTALLETQRRYAADVVAGPVFNVFPAAAPDWIRSGGLFDHPRHRTGYRIDSCSSANVLIATRALRRVQPWFDERLALTGGSDRHFFLRLSAAGYRLVWCDEAIVYEEVPGSRAQLPWLLKRMYRQGISNGFCDIDLQRGPLPRARTAVVGAAFIGGGLGLLPVGVLRGRARLVRYLRYIAYGGGLLQACRGAFYDEYATVHGR